ncbi:MAG TPA: FGGY family carbohydrate kinase [Anaerolineales bacterium]|nr:FGGY family carbohydrate kinase [Anaerolineales bacterium]
MTTSVPRRVSRDEHAILLGIDIGTSRLKIGSYDADLHLLNGNSADTGDLPGARKGQLDPASLWQAVKDQVQRLLRSVDGSRVAAIGIAGMAESGCLIDADGRPITPILLWHDRRGIRQATALRRKAGDEFARLTGLKISSVRSIAKWMWLTDHDAPRHARWCGAPEWIALCLTGKWCTDATLAVRTGAFDVLKGAYSFRLLGRAGAPAGLFPPVHATPAPAGTVLAAVGRDLGLPKRARVVIAGHDDIVAAYGVGGRPGDLIDSAGTAEGLIRIVGVPPQPVETARAHMAMARFQEPGTWALIAGAGSTGALMQLAADALGRGLQELDEIASAPGQYPPGVISVRLTKNALPTIQIREGAPAGEVWSAVLDLVCDRVQGAADRLESLAGGASRLVVMGGAARSRELMWRKSERLGLPTVAITEMDATTRGAAALASLASAGRVEIGFQGGMGVPSPDA